MEIKIVIFLMFTSVTLIFNSLVIWFAYKAFANVTTKVTDSVRELHASESMKVWFGALESASFRAIDVTEAAKTQVGNLGPVLTRAQSRYGYGLARVEIRAEEIFSKFHEGAEATQEVLLRPVHRVGRALFGLREFLEFLTGGKIDDGARPTPIEQSRRARFP